MRGLTVGLLAIALVSLACATRHRLPAYDTRPMTCGLDCPPDSPDCFQVQPAAALRAVRCWHEAR